MKETDVNWHSYGCTMLAKEAKNTDWKEKKTQHPQQMLWLN